MSGKSTPLWLALRLQCILCLDCLTRAYSKESKRYCWAFGIAALKTAEITTTIFLVPSPGGCCRCGSKNNRCHHNSALAAVSPQPRHPVTTHKLICHLGSQGVTSRIHSVSLAVLYGQRRLTLDYHRLNKAMPPPDLLELQYKLEPEADKQYATTILLVQFSAIGNTVRPIQCTGNQLFQRWKDRPTTSHGLTKHWNKVKLQNS